MVARKIYTYGIKPVFDWLFALVLLFILSPLLVLVLIVLSIHFSGKPFFIHRRVGKSNQVFWMLKFRSMTEIKGDDVSHQDRITGVGRFIRKTSIDELPQLVNVLKGDMSLIGPRPLPIEYLPYYNSEEIKRHLVKPGITGLAQINGRNKVEWSERLKADVAYVDKVSFPLDIKILIQTCFTLFKFNNTTFKDGKVITFTEYASKR